MGRRSDARERITAAAAALFHESGYHAVGVSEICARAGLQKGSFYHFFESKRRLALAVVDAHASAVGKELAGLENGAGPALGRLREFFESIHRRQVDECACGARVLGCPLGNLALELATYDEELRQALLNGLVRQVTALERLLRQAVAEGELSAAVDPAAAARALVALLEGQLLFAKLRNDAAPLADLAPAIDRILGLSA
jgi:TetR/AcrR family transcriptional repressor of nem operon